MHEQLSCICHCSINSAILLCSVPVDSLPGIQGLQGEDLLRRLLDLDHGKRTDIRTFDPENLVHQVDRGDMLVVRQLVKDHPEKVNVHSLKLLFPALGSVRLSLLALV